MSSIKVMPAVSTAFDFTCTKVTENMVKFIRSENVEMSEAQMRKMAAIVRGTFEQSLGLTSTSIEQAANSKK